MSVDNFGIFYDQGEEDVSCSLSDELDRINPDVAEMSGHQHDAIPEISGEPNSDKKLTKLQQMLASSSFSSGFASEILISDELKHIKSNFAEMCGDQQDATFGIGEQPKSHMQSTKLQQILASSSFSSSFLKNETHVAHVENASPRSALTSLGEVNDGPSKRAASLLLSRSSATGLQSPQLEVKQTIATQHWNGSKICDDPYETTIFRFAFS